MKKWAKFLLASGAVALALGWAQSTEASRIEENAAKQLAAERYQQLFADKFYRNPVDGQYRPFPKLTARQFTFAKAAPDGWTVESTPPAGVYVHARVDLKGQWVDLTRVGFAAE